MHKNDEIEYNLEIDSSIQLKNDTILYLGLLANELVVNAFKHAFHEQKGFLNIKIDRNPNQSYQLVVTDNGSGYDVQEVSKAPKTSIGQQLIRSFVKQLNGTLNIESSSLGSSFQITFNELA